MAPSKLWVNRPCRDPNGPVLDAHPDADLVLVGRQAGQAGDRTVLESAGGVSAAEAARGSRRVRRADRGIRCQRDAAVPDPWAGPRPSGGVLGGVKCLHAHYA